MDPSQGIRSRLRGAGKPSRADDGGRQRLRGQRRGNLVQLGVYDVVRVDRVELSSVMVYGSFAAFLSFRVLRRNLQLIVFLTCDVFLSRSQSSNVVVGRVDCCDARQIYTRYYRYPRLHEKFSPSTSTHTMSIVIYYNP